MSKSPAEKLNSFLDKEGLSLSISPLVFVVTETGTLSLAEPPQILVTPITKEPLNG